MVSEAVFESILICCPLMYLQEFFIVGSHVEGDRKSLARLDASKSRVEGQFANWDSHALVWQFSLDTSNL